MRVLFLTGEYPVMQGGVGDYTRQLCRALCRLGAEVGVLTGRAAGGDDSRRLAYPTDDAESEPAVFPAIAYPGWGIWRQAAEVASQYRAQVIHIQYQAAAYHMHPAVNFLPRWLHAMRRGVRVVTTFHDLRIPYLFPKAGSLRWRTVLALAYGSDGVVLTNPVDWARLEKTSLAGRLWPIPIGSNIRCQPPADYDRSRQRAAWGVGPADWLLTYFGFLNAEKGGEALIRALAALVRAERPAHLLMVGGQVGASDLTNLDYLHRVQGLAQDMGLAERIHWTGFVTPAQVSANLLAADCAVLPYREGASLRHGSLMAALTHGLPIVTTQAPPSTCSGQAEFVCLEEGSSALLVPPDDPQLLAGAVIRIMSDNQLCARLSQAARDLSREFTWDTIARRHLEAYHSLGVG